MKKISKCDPLKRIASKYMNIERAIPCRCDLCGGEGYAQDESMLDKEGYLTCGRCACGGRIRRNDR